MEIIYRILRLITGLKGQEAGWLFDGWHTRIRKKQNINDEIRPDYRPDFSLQFGQLSVFRLALYAILLLYSLPHFEQINHASFCDFSGRSYGVKSPFL